MTQTLKINKTRFDTRISVEQKEMFEKAARIGGFRSLTDFVLSTVQEKAKELIIENEKLIKSAAEAEYFYKIISNPPKPNSKLKSAAKKYKATLK